jgi:Fe-S-cluster-containing dehydrogenase component
MGDRTMGKKSFLIDVDKCTSCMLCVISCKDEHVDNEYLPWTRTQPGTGQFCIDVQPLERGSICENAPCIKVCPEGAIKTRPDGLVWIDPASCTNCGLCQPACPYDVIYMNEDLGIAQKCTGCAHRVDQGALPRCAEVCPHDVILFGDEADPIFDDGEQGDALEVFHPEYQAAPRVHWKGLPKPWIAGTVIDASEDEVMPGVAITTTDLFDNGSVTVLSDEFGDFWIRGLEKDRKYRVEIKKGGYEDVLAIVTTDGDQDVGTVSLQRIP